MSRERDITRLKATLYRLECAWESVKELDSGKEFAEMPEAVKDRLISMLVCSRVNSPLPAEDIKKLGGRCVDHVKNSNENLVFGEGVMSAMAIVDLPPGKDPELVCPNCHAVRFHEVAGIERFVGHLLDT